MVLIFELPNHFLVVFFFVVFLPFAFSDELREHLKNAPKVIMAQQRAGASDSDSDSSDDSSSEGWRELFLLTFSYK